MAQSKFSQLANKSSKAVEAGSSKAAISPKAKSKDKDNYMSTTVYLPRPLHRQVKAKLALEDQEFSRLMELLLSEWVGHKAG